MRVGCPSRRIKRCRKRTIIVAPCKKRKHCVARRKKAVCVKLRVRPGNGNPAITTGSFRRVGTFIPASIFTFANNSPILVPATAGSAGPAVLYPSIVSVSGLGGTVAKVTVTLFNLNLDSPVDLDIMLVGPDGFTGTILMAGAGGGVPGITDVTVSFDDTAANFIPKDVPLFSGTFRPTNYEGLENLPAPAPPTPPSIGLSVFNGMNPNGNWRLFVSADAATDIGQIANGWALSITTPETEESVYTPL